MNPSLTGSTPTLKLTPEQFRPISRLIPNPTDPHKTIVSKVAELCRRSDNYRRRLYQGRGLEYKLRSDYRLYKGWKSKSASSETRHTVRLIYKMVRTIFAELLRGRIQPKIDFKMIEDSDRAEIAELFLREQALMANDLAAWQVFTRRKILHGCAIMRKDWKIFTRRFMKKKLNVNSSTGQVAKAADLMEEVWFKGPVNTPVQLEDFYWDEFGTDMTSCAWVVERVRNFTPQDMFAYLQQGIFQVKAEDLKEIEESVGPSYELTATNPLEDYSPNKGDINNDQSWTLDRFYSDDFVFYVLNGTYLMNQDPQMMINPYQIRHRHAKPYIHSTLYTTGEFTGEGIAELAASYQHYASASLRMELEQIYSAIRRKFIIQEGSVRDMTKLYDETDTAIVAVDANGIKPLDPPQTFGAGRQLTSSLVNDAEQDLGIVPIMQGQRTPGNTSATEAADIGEQVDKQIAAMAQNQIESADEDVKMSCEYNRLFLDYAKVVWKGRPTNLNGDIFDLEDLLVEVVPESILANVGSLAQKRLEVFVQSVAQDPTVNWPWIRRMQARKAGIDPEQAFTQPAQAPSPAPSTGAPQPTGKPNNQGGGPAIGKSPQPAGPAPAAMAQALQGLNPMGMTGGGSPNVQLGESAGEAVTGF